MQDIIYSDRSRSGKIIENMSGDGCDRLHILADFDRTLTYALVDGEKKPSLIGVIRSNPKYLGQEYSDKANALFDRYHPIEIDPNIPLGEKIKQMNNWWKSHLELLISSGLHKTHIEEASNSGIIKTRSGVVSFLQDLDKNNIPLVIMSANGLGKDSIISYLESNNLYFPNIHVISNQFEFSDDGHAIGYKGHIVHVFNKGEVLLGEFPDIEEQVINRKNVILLGDSLGDHHMVDGFETDNVLKIGFYNENTMDNIDYYKERYDIVLTGDSDGEYLNELLKKIRS